MKADVSMLEKVKEFFYKWQDKVTKLWADKSYIRASLVYLLPIVFIALLIVFTIKAITAGFNFLCRYYAQLIFAALAICVFVAWLDKRKANNIEIERQAQEIRERKNFSDRYETAKTQDATYNAQGKIVFSVAPELGPLGVVPPATLSNIYSPGRTVPVANGAVMLNLFLLQKNGETVDTDLLKHTLQVKIDQRLQAGEFPGIPEQHVYRGRVYSGLAVDMVRDSIGGFVEVYTVLVDDAYCRYRENRELNGYRLLPSVDRRDADY